LATSANAGSPAVLSSKSSVECSFTPVLHAFARACPLHRSHIGQSRPWDRKVDVNSIKRAVVTALLAGTVIVPPSLAEAQDHGRRDRQEDRRDNRRHDNRHDNGRRVGQREWRNYDYNRFEPGQRRYDAARYYTWDDRTYRERRLEANDRIYRGTDDRYYCRRSDGTTGLIVGGIAGGVLGHVIAPGDSKTLGTILGAGGGALLGRAIDRNRVICR
jgi:Ni/Co efflux regulator RcnB